MLIFKDCIGESRATRRNLAYILKKGASLGRGHLGRGPSSRRKDKLCVLIDGKF